MVESDSPGEGYKLHFFDYHCEDLWGCREPEGQRDVLINLGLVGEPHEFSSTWVDGIWR